MESIDWKTVVIAAVAGAAIISAAWLLIPFGAALARKSDGLVREGPAVNAQPQPAHADLESEEAEKEIRQVRDR
jgi:hypothetical protein